MIYLIDVYRHYSVWSSVCWRLNLKPRKVFIQNSLTSCICPLTVGVYCCGPCPVKAVREGEVGMKYDALFVFSEVNADMVYWIVHPNKEKTQVSVNRTTVGRNISTKSVYGDYREDITANYKYPEGILFNLPVITH